MFDRGFTVFACLVAFPTLAFYGALGYVAVHFIGKFW